MGNILKMVLILIGILLMGYGVYIWLAPNVDAGFGTFQVSPTGKSQIFAMIGLGFLFLISGIAYKKR